MSAHVKRWQPWLFWFLGAVFFFFEYVVRVDPSGMLKELSQFFHLHHNLSKGTLSAYFYLPYVIMQIPVGFLVDKYGPRRWLAVAALVSAAGSLLFAESQYLWQAECGRLLIGFGASFAFVGTMRIATLWFSKRRLGLLAGLTQGVGMLGAAAGVGVVPMVINSMGWQHIMRILALLLAVFGVLIFLCVRDRAVVNSHQINQKPKLWSSLATVMKSKVSWLNALYVGFLYAPTAALAELWGTSFFHHIYGFTKIGAGWIMSCIFIGLAVGGPFAGWLSDRFSRRKPFMLLSVSVCFVVLLGVLMIPSLDFLSMSVLLFIYGFFSVGVALSYAVAGEIHSPMVAGVSMAFTNMMSIAIGAILQPLLGWLLDLYLRHASGSKTSIVYAYTHVMWLLPICLFISLLCIVLLRESSLQGGDNE
jgi:MFS family permease